MPVADAKLPWLAIPAQKSTLEVSVGLGAYSDVVQAAWLYCNATFLWKFTVCSSGMLPWNRIICKLLIFLLEDSLASIQCIINPILHFLQKKIPWRLLGPDVQIKRKVPICLLPFQKTSSATTFTNITWHKICCANMNNIGKLHSRCFSCTAYNYGNTKNSTLCLTQTRA